MPSQIVDKDDGLFLELVICFVQEATDGMGRRTGEIVKKKAPPGNFRHVGQHEGAQGVHDVGQRIQMGNDLQPSE